MGEKKKSNANTTALIGAAFLMQRLRSDLVS
mgnify:CR=1 FL=1